MTAYLLRRLGTSIIVLVGISIFIYLLLHAIYPSPARAVLIAPASDNVITQNFIMFLLLLFRIVFSSFPEPKLHNIDLGLLIDQDLLSEPTHHRGLSVDQFGFRHIDCTLMMRDHHGREIMIDVSVHRCACHLTIHMLHACAHRLHELCGCGPQLGPSC